MFGSRKGSVPVKTVEEFLAGQSAEALADDGGVPGREFVPKVKGWLIVAMVVATALLALSVLAFAKIARLSRDVALLRSQPDGKTVEDLKGEVRSLSTKLGKSDSETEYLRSRIVRLERSSRRQGRRPPVRRGQNLKSWQRWGRIIRRKPGRIGNKGRKKLPLASSYVLTLRATRPKK